MKRPRVTIEDYYDVMRPMYIHGMTNCLLYVVNRTSNNESHYTNRRNQEKVQENGVMDGGRKGGDGMRAHWKDGINVF